MAVAMLTVSASAQKTAVTANKAGDNWYLGINAGVATPMQKWGDYGFMKDAQPVDTLVHARVCLLRDTRLVTRRPHPTGSSLKEERNNRINF